jgi:hypothetical protein
MSMNFTDLPDDALSLCLGQCSLHDLMNVRLANQQLNAYLTGDDFWTMRFLADFFVQPNSATEYRAGQVFTLYQHYFKTVRGWTNPHGGNLKSSVTLPMEIYAIDASQTGEILCGLQGRDSLVYAAIEDVEGSKQLRVLDKSFPLPKTTPYSMSSDAGILGVGFGGQSGFYGFSLKTGETLFSDSTPNTVLDCQVTGNLGAYSGYFSNFVHVADIVAGTALHNFSLESPAGVLVSMNTLYAGSRDAMTVFDLRAQKEQQRVSGPFDLLWRIRQVDHLLYIGGFSGRYGVFRLLIRFESHAQYGSVCFRTMTECLPQRWRRSLSLVPSTRT